jgi:hypothetical protein
MAFTPKTWVDGPGGGTPLSAAALIDLETRLAANPNTVGYQVGLASGRYGVAGSRVWTGPGATTQNLLLFAPVTFLAARTVTGLGTRVWTAGSTGAVMRLGLYDVASDGRPGALLVDTGSVSATAAGNIFGTVSYAVSTGRRYYVAFVSQGGPTTAPQFLASSNTAPMMGEHFTTSELSSTIIHGGYGITGVTGALTSDASSAAIAGELPPRIYVGS